MLHAADLAAISAILNNPETYAFRDVTLQGTARKGPRANGF